MGTLRCRCCGKLVRSNPRLKHQLYCSAPNCQRERKRLWQKEKLRADPDYRANQRECQRRWFSNHLDYWQKWRKTRSSLGSAAKMDSLQPYIAFISGPCLILGIGENGVKMDALPPKAIIFSIR